MRQIGPMGVVDEEGQHAMEAAGKSRTEGTETMLTAVPDPLQARGVKAAPEADTECWYYGKKGHRESECWKKHADLDKFGSDKTSRENRQSSHYVGGSEGSGTGKTGKGPTFVMKHKANSMKKTTSKLEEVSYVDSGASNQMTSHKEVLFFGETGITGSCKSL